MADGRGDTVISGLDNSECLTQDVCAHVQVEVKLIV